MIKNNQHHQQWNQQNPSTNIPFQQNNYQQRPSPKPTQQHQQYQQYQQQYFEPQSRNQQQGQNAFDDRIENESQLNHTFSEDSNSEITSVDNAQLTQNPRHQQQQRPVQKQIEKQPKTLVIITIDVGGGNSDVIHVLENDDLYTLASTFCHKHSLEDSCIQLIIENIRSELERKSRKKKKKQQQQLQAPPTSATNVRESTESPKFYAKQDKLSSQQGSKQQPAQSEPSKKKNRTQQPSFGQDQFFEQQQQQQYQQQQQQHTQQQYQQQNQQGYSRQHPRFVQDQIKEEEYEDQSVSYVGQTSNVSLAEENHEHQQTNKYTVKNQQMPSSNTQSLTPSSNQNRSTHSKLYSQQQQSQRSLQDLYQQAGRDEAIITPQSATNDLSDQDISDYEYQTGYQQQQPQQQRQQRTQNNYYSTQPPNQKQQHQRGQLAEPPTQASQLPQHQYQSMQHIIQSDHDFQKPNMYQFTSLKQQDQKARQQHQQVNNYNNENDGFEEMKERNSEDQPEIYDEQEVEFDNEDNNMLNTHHRQPSEQRKQLIDQISQKLNLSRQRVPIEQQTQQKQVQPLQKNPSTATTVGGAVQKKGNKVQSNGTKFALASLQQQLLEKKQQFFDSYNQAKSNHNNQAQTQNSEEISARYDTSPDQHNQNQRSTSPVLSKSYSNNALYTASAVRQTNQQSDSNSSEISPAQQSYESWQKILAAKSRPKNKSSVSHNKSGSNYGGTAATTFSKSPFNMSNHNMNSSVSPRHLHKNKSATQLSPVIMPASNKNANNSTMNHSNRHNNSSQQLMLSPHEKLYRFGLDQMQRKQRVFEENNLKKQQVELSQTTFRPSISPQSRQLKLQEGVRIEEYLLQEGKKQKERKVIAAIVHDEESTQACTFKPSVSLASQKIVQESSTMSNNNNHNHNQESQQSGGTYYNNSNSNSNSVQQQHNQSSSIHDRLYQQGLQDKASKEEWSQKQFNLIYPFTPDLGPHNPYNNIPGYVRPPKQFEHVNTQAAIQQRKLAQEYDPVTGQKLYHPFINKNDPIYQKVSQRVDLQDDLLEEELKLKSRSTSPMSSQMLHQSSKVSKQSTKQQTGTTKPRIGNLPWDSQLRDNRNPVQYDTLIRSTTPRSRWQQQTQPNNNSNRRQFDGSISMMGGSPTHEIENILRQSSPFSTSHSTKSKQNGKQSNSIPIVVLDRSQLLRQSHQQQQQQSQVRQSLQIPTGEVLIDRSHMNSGEYQGQQSFLRGAIPNLFSNERLGEKLSELFEQFDTDGDGLINAMHIDISSSDPAILEIIQDVLYQIDEKNLTLNKNQFTHFLNSNGLIFPLKQVIIIY